VAELRRDNDGVWTLDVGELEREERSEFQDEALPRYLTAFDPVFARAEEACECEFVKALIRVSALQDAGWDPYETTLRAIPAMVEVHSELVAPDERHFEVAKHLELWTYGHIIEASEPYAILADMLHIANGGFFMPGRFPEKPIYPPTDRRPNPPTRPQFFREKLVELERLAREAQLPDALDPVREVWDNNLRNAVFHADYSLYGGEVRTEARVYSHEDVQRIVNRALAYHNALATLVREHRRGYTEPTRVTVHPDQATEPGEAMYVMVREGTGAIGSFIRVHTGGDRGGRDLGAPRPTLPGRGFRGCSGPHTADIPRARA
jgi:hypothetical protein